MLKFKDFITEGTPENPKVKYDYYKSIKRYTHPAKSASSKGGGASSGSAGSGGGGSGGGSGAGGGGI